MIWRTIDTIIEDRLFLGSLMAARSAQTLSDRTITHILSACPDPVQIPAGINLIHTRIPIDDVDDADLLIHLPHACQFIEDALENGGNVLVHCVQGISRSATIVAAYLMWKRRITPQQALEEIRAARDQVSPNAGFMEQLAVFERCQYAPSLENEIYVQWRAQLERRVREEYDTYRMPFYSKLWKHLFKMLGL